MFKKIFSLSIAILLYSLNTSTTLAAATVSLSPPQSSVNLGSNIAITVNINPNGATVGAAEMNFNYDPSMFSYISFNPGAFNVCVPGSDTNGSIVRNCAVLSGVSSPASFGTITLKTLKSGQGNLSVSGQVLDANNQNQFNGAVKGNYTIIGTQPTATTNKVLGVSTTATPTPNQEASTASQPTTTVTFKAEEKSNPELANSSNWVNVILIVVAGGGLLYILYKKGWLNKLLRSLHLH